MESFPATVKLFDNDAYTTDFEAKVLSAEPAGKEIEKDKGEKTPDSWIVVLDRTLFFPEEGGQTPDKGEIDGFPVIDVQLDGDVIRHLIRVPDGLSAGPEKKQEEGAAGGPAAAGSAQKEGTAGESAAAGSAQEERAPFSAGQTVRGHIDFSRRFSNMQNHSGEHILSGLVHGRFGYDNVGFHLSDNTVTLDFNGPLSEEEIDWLEQAANRVVWDNREIRAWYPDEEEIQTREYRSKKEIDGPLRLVEIPGVDVCACCAPHVRRTGEIGLIKIIRTLRERGGIRLTILCGSRALACVQQMQRAAEDVSHLTNMPREEIAAGVARILEENEQLRRRGASLETQVTDALAAAVPAGQENVFLFAGNTSAENSGEKKDDREAALIGNLAQRRLVNSLCAAHPGYCGVFVGDDSSGYRYIIGATKKKDARVLNACLHKACGARGGGKPAMVQGSVHASESGIRKALEQALHEIEEQ